MGSYSTGEHSRCPLTLQWLPSTNVDTNAPLGRGIDGGFSTNMLQIYDHLDPRHVRCRIRGRDPGDVMAGTEIWGFTPFGPDPSSADIRGYGHAADTAF